MAKAPLLLFYKFLCVTEFYHYCCSTFSVSLVKLWSAARIPWLKIFPSLARNVTPSDKLGNLSLVFGKDRCPDCTRVSDAVDGDVCG